MTQIEAAVTIVVRRMREDQATPAKAEEYVDSLIASARRRFTFMDDGARLEVMRQALLAGVVHALAQDN